MSICRCEHEDHFAEDPETGESLAPRLGHHPYGQAAGRNEEMFAAEAVGWVCRPCMRGHMAGRMLPIRVMEIVAIFPDEVIRFTLSPTNTFPMDLEMFIGDIGDEGTFVYQMREVYPA